MSSYLKWELYSHTRPTVPGDYWIATLKHPENGWSSSVTNFATVPLQAAWHDLAYLLDIAPECLLWYGPLEWPDIKQHAMKRLVKAQQQEFVRVHEKHCCECGDITGVNSRSIPYRDQPMDCRKCERINTVRIRRKLIPASSVM
jgi:hypothetical protein